MNSCSLTTELSTEVRVNTVYCSLCSGKFTNGKGNFGKLIFKNFHPHAGVILFRRMQLGDMQAKLDRLTYVLTAYAKWLHHFLVVTPTTIYVKKTLAQKAG